ncbi:MAG: Trk family potassium uptake protein [Clostridia bacterium]|nr:Trk family potassium uptake protein [Clostridia bacterium]
MKNNSIFLHKKTKNTDNTSGTFFTERKTEPAKRSGLKYIQVIALVFIVIIIIGTILLTLPISTKSGENTSLSGALFTSTSATCVTGLVVYDTYSHWSLFGQIVILLLIQTGGLGFMSVAAFFSTVARRKIGLKERELMQESVNTLEVGGIVHHMRFILIGALSIEACGAFLLSLKFIPEMGWGRGIWNSIFHSVSAMCNAGFDLMGKKSAFSSLTLYYNDVYINLVIMSLIIIGGIGFVVWEDLKDHGFCFSKYKLHSKLVLVTTSALLLFGAVTYFVFEYNHTLAGMSLGEKILCSMFQSVTFRTAGFVTVDMSQMSSSMISIASVLMIIGGSPGSTAGGIKTTTIAVLVLGTLSVIRKRKSVTAFGKRFEDELLKKTLAIAVIYIIMAFSSVSIICAVESASLEAVTLEIFSAVGTVGLSMGLTPLLGTFSRIWVAMLMYFGRIGGLSIILAVAGREISTPIEKPIEKISVG